MASGRHRVGDQLDEPTAIVDGYNSYFSFSKGRSGYSGVATFVKHSCTPIKAEESISGILVPHDQEGIGCHGNQSGFSDEEIQLLDNEGRTVITQHKIMDTEGTEQLLNIVNVYCPRADPENEARKEFKISFYKLLQIRVEAMLKNGCHVIVLGDINTPHKKLDHCEPSDDQEFFSHPGRRWLEQFLWNPEHDGNLNEITIKHKSDKDTNLMKETGGKFVDSFRLYHPTTENAFTAWSTITGSRATNYGVRIDYIFGDIDLIKRSFTGCDIMPDVMGSDHCPVQATLDWEIIPSKRCPQFCTKFMPEFTGKQQKLFSFFTKKDSVVKKSDINERCALDKVKTMDTSEVTSSQESTGCGSLSEGCGGALSQEVLSLTPDYSKSPKKRSAGEAQKSKSNAKRLKKEDKRPSNGKQGNLLAFFSKKPCKETVAKTETEMTGNHNLTKIANTPKLNAKSDCIELADEQVSKFTPSLQKGASVSWKRLLKGPPPAPLCKGHQEACLLRTVKKDSLNKGRQFWVCPKPDGHKSNPDARCSHFVWVDEKKKL